MYTVVHLPWDSEHFGRRIGSMELPSGHDGGELEDTLAHAALGNYGMIYMFAPAASTITAGTLMRFSGRKMPTRLVFEREVGTGEAALDLYVRSYKGEGLHPELVDLALRCGATSRFKLDPVFSEEQYKSLYKTWLMRSVARELADEVFVYGIHGTLAGFITVSVRAHIGKVGLLSVSPLVQGRGIGSSLLNAVIHYLSERGVPIIQVPTQAENLNAVGFYLKNGFSTIERADIYHLLPEIP